MSISYLSIYCTFLLCFLALLTFAEWILNKNKDSSEGNYADKTFESMEKETFMIEKSKKVPKNRNFFPKKNNRKKNKNLKYAKSQINKIDLIMDEPKQDNHGIVLMKNNDTRNEISAKKDSNLDDGKKAPDKKNEDNQNIKFGNGQNNYKIDNKENKELKEKLEQLNMKIDKFEQVLKNNNLVFNIHNIRITSLEKDNYFLKSAYKVLFYRKISNSLLEKIFTQKENFKKTPVLFEDETKPIEKRTKFPIIIAIKPDDKKKRNEINLLIDYLMFVRDYSSSIIHISDKKAFYQIEYLLSYLNLKKEYISDKDNRYETLALTTSDILSLLFDNKIDDSNDNKDGNINNINDFEIDINNIYLNINENFDFLKEDITKKI